MLHFYVLIFLYYDFFLFFFFFQAEDGIRDLTVTGVQTCALPISIRRETVCFSWNSDMLMVVMNRSPPKRRSATPRAHSVFPTPLGPTKRKTPKIGRASCRERV